MNFSKNVITQKFPKYNEHIEDVPHYRTIEEIKTQLNKLDPRTSDIYDLVTLFYDAIEIIEDRQDIIHTTMKELYDACFGDVNEQRIADFKSAIKHLEGHLIKANLIA